MKHKNNIMAPNRIITKNITHTLLGIAVAFSVSLLVEKVFFAFIRKLCLMLDEFVYVPSGISMFIIFSIMVGAVCYILYLICVEILKKNLRTEIFDKRFYITLVISIFVYAFVSGWYWDTKEEFGIVSFFVIVFMWIVAGIINVLFLGVKKIRNSKLSKEQKQWHPKDM